ncbi:DUF2516 family protein [Ornithinimicrobium sediminis]|jgi:hypothetical protein|uniref:DUF2516 family protein n=1 Tax=Ornithinimicrobium sediminis TaxID=2904603 RepID=UPI001E4566E5|nr:DUF2516 family protein [Ornithinimicrobium sediminis]MCE0487325.1 DUF2516 family protein [Ornithinimicrobium sediminis]
MNFGSLQGFVLFGLGLLALGITVWALIDAATTRADAFVAAGKRTKGFWVAVTGVAAALVFVTFPNVLSIFGLISLVAAAIYLTDVRPAVRSLRGGSSGGTHMGPYGPW